MFIVSFFCSACSPQVTSPNQPAQATATPRPTQPVSASQLLSNSVTYVALGASDAVGVGSTQPGAQGYVPLIAEKLPKGSHLVNLGLSGIHLHEALSKELPLAIATSPRLITIWLVANDFVAGVSYESYMQDLSSLLQQLRAGTQARIVMANLPDLTRLPIFGNLTAPQKEKMLTEIKHWNNAILEIAQHYAVAIVDLQAEKSKLTTHPEYISIDGFHPSPAGYVELANTFWQAIKE